MENISTPAETSSNFKKFAMVLGAIGVVGFLSYGYLAIRHRYAKERVVAQVAAEEAKKHLVREAALSISENEVQPKGSKAVVSGTVRNLSKAEIKDLVLEFELTQRKSAEKEKKLTLIKDSILPDGEARYNLVLPANTYRTVRIARVYSEKNSGEDLAFNTSTGEQRAKQPPPGDAAGAPSKRRTNQTSDGFLNSPDQPVSLP